MIAKLNLLKFKLNFLQLMKNESADFKVQHKPSLIFMILKQLIEKASLKAYKPSINSYRLFKSLIPIKLRNLYFTVKMSEFY